MRVAHIAVLLLASGACGPEGPGGEMCVDEPWEARSCPLEPCGGCWGVDETGTGTCMVDVASVTVDELARLLVYAEIEHPQWCEWEDNALGIAELALAQEDNSMLTFQEVAQKPEEGGRPDLESMMVRRQGLCDEGGNRVLGLSDYLYNAIDPPAITYTCCAEPGCIADFECDAMSEPGADCIPGQK